MTDRAQALEHRYARRIGARMRELREARSWTQRQLAERIDVYTREISRWESGQQLPPLRRLLQMAEALDLEPGELLGRDPRGGLADRLAAAHRLCGPGTRETAAALFEVALALIELDEPKIEALVGALQVAEGAARLRQKGGEARRD